MPEPAKLRLGRATSIADPREAFLKTNPEVMGAPLMPIAGLGAPTGMMGAAGEIGTMLTDKLQREYMNHLATYFFRKMYDVWQEGGSKERKLRMSEKLHAP